MKRVAILGASADRAKYGNKAVRAFLERGYTVFPVNPRESTIEGLTCYADIGLIEEPLDEISVYLPPAILEPLLPAIAEKGCQTLWLNPGTDTPEIVQRAAALNLPFRQACSIVALGLSPAQF